MIFRNSILSLASLAIPLIVGLVTVPYIIKDLGLQRFGILTLVWAFIGYASLFDLGISRALTKRVAALSEEAPKLRSLVRSGLCLMSLIGVAMGLLTLTTAFQFDYQRFDLAEDEFKQGAWLLAASVPLVILSSGLRGVLEGLHQFSVVAFVRLGFGLITFTAPFFFVTSAPRVDYIVAIMLGARIIGTLIMAWYCRSYLTRGNMALSRRRVEIRNMLTFGGWITASNLASSLMLYMDRFFLASSPFSSSLAFYTTPYELATKLFILPSALSGVLFPHMAKGTKQSNDQARLLTAGSILVLASITPLTALIIFFAPELLAWWVSPEFSNESASVLKVLSMGVLVNSLAQVFQTHLLAQNKAASIAKMHLIELCIILPTLYFGIQNFGIEGAAWIWTIRVILDSLGMALILGRANYVNSRYWDALITSILIAVILFLVSTLGFYTKLALLSAVSLACLMVGLRFFHGFLASTRTE